MERKQLEKFLDISNEEFTFVKNVRSHIGAILERKFDIWSISAGIEMLEVEIYVYPLALVYRLLKDTIQIFKKESEIEETPSANMKMEIKNNEIYNNIVDKINEKNKNYLSVKLLELTRLED